MKKILALTAVLAVSACAAKQQVVETETVKYGFHGKTGYTFLEVQEQDLINNFGQPDDVYVMSERYKDFTYFKKDENGKTICTSEYSIKQGVTVSLSVKGEGCGQ